MQFMQLGDIFVNPDRIVYVDFSDAMHARIVLQSVDKEDCHDHGVRHVVSEEMCFDAGTVEYGTLRTWFLALPIRESEE